MYLKRIINVCTILVVLTGPASAQRLLMESKAGFSASFAAVFPIGDAEVKKGSFSFPALVANLQQGYGATLEYNQQLPFSSHLLAGLRYSYFSFSDWEHASDQHFTDATAVVQALEFGVRGKTSFHEQGLFNKTSLYGGLSTGAYPVNVVVPDALFKSDGASSTTEDFVSKAVRPGVSVQAGLEQAVSNNWSILVQGGYQIIFVKSNYYQETSFRWFQLNVGLAFRLKKDRYYLRERYE